MAFDKRITLETLWIIAAKSIRGGKRGRIEDAGRGEREGAQHRKGGNSRRKSITVFCGTIKKEAGKSGGSWRMLSLNWGRTGNAEKQILSEVRTYWPAYFYIHEGYDATAVTATFGTDMIQ